MEDAHQNMSTGLWALRRHPDRNDDSYANLFTLSKIKEVPEYHILFGDYGFAITALIYPRQSRKGLQLDGINRARSIARLCPNFFSKTTMMANARIPYFPLHLNCMRSRCQFTTVSLQMHSRSLVALRHWRHKQIWVSKCFGNRRVASDVTPSVHLTWNSAMYCRDPYHTGFVLACHVPASWPKAPKTLNDASFRFDSRSRSPRPRAS